MSFAEVLKYEDNGKTADGMRVEERCEVAGESVEVGNEVAADSVEAVEIVAVTGESFKVALGIAE